MRAEHHRMLGNGWCRRPAELDCSFETICEGCGFFATAIEFKPTLQRQADDAAAHDQAGRAELYQRLADSLGEEEASWPRRRPHRHPRHRLLHGRAH
ncbi:MAG: hypothetical protein M3063_06870 [Actinomycetota bacterium]|nr:hypothetical protein [Actinomycetota bacterium]